MGRRSGISRSERLLRAEIARALSTAIGGSRGAQSSAAEQLGISRQAISLYIQQKSTPSSEILRRMCQTLKLTLNVEGATVDLSAFAQETPDKTPVQTSLFDALSDVGDQKLDVKVLRKRAQSLDLQVTIDFHPTSKKAQSTIRRVPHISGVRA
ncbi:MAG: helix-turn-helix domain-containing protein [Terriglobales bacterium]